MADYGVVLFHTTSAAFGAEKALNKAGIKCALIPVPRELSSDCGIAMRFQWADRESVARTLEEAGVETAATHRLGRQS